MLTHCKRLKVRCVLSAFLPSERAREVRTYLEARRTYGNVVGVCLAADAEDWEDQLVAIGDVLEAGGWIRWVKGGWYREGQRFGVGHWRKISMRFAAISVLLAFHAMETGCGHLLATHDKRAIRLARAVRMRPRLAHHEAGANSIRTLVSYGTYSARIDDDVDVGMFYGDRLPFVAETVRYASLYNLFLRVMGLRLVFVPSPTKAGLEREIRREVQRWRR